MSRYEEGLARGGGDKSRAKFTSRVVVITETDGMDKSGVASREADKVTQLEARTRAYGSRKRIYLERTVSTQDGRTWQEYREGTASQILLRCPICRDWVSVERQHLRGGQDALSQAEARRKGTYACPNCGMFWTENDRRQANVDSQLVHEGQEITAEGSVTGDSKETETLGFRWSAVHNLFQTAADVAADEWKAARSPDEDNAEREMRQFVWCLPVVPNRWEETALQAEEITRRVSIWPPGVVPPGTEYLTAAMDLGKYLCHWIIVAWQEDASGYIVDYGRLEVASEDLGLEPALLLAMQEFSNLVRMRLPMGIGENEPSRVEDNCKAFDAAWIDAGYMTETVYKFCRTTPGIFPAVGRGAKQISTRWDQPSNSKRSRLRGVGEGYTGNDLLDHGVTLLEVNADHRKSWVHQRLTTPLSQPGGMRLFQAAPHEHLSLAKHLTAERKIEEFVVGKGMVTRWERIRKNNHWFDALYNACAAGHAVGVRLFDAERIKPQPRRKFSEIAAEKRERGFVDLERWRGIRSR